MNFKILEISIKIITGILIRIALYVWFIFGNKDIWTWSFPLYEHEVLLHFFVPALISFINILKYAVYKSFTSYIFLNR